MDAPGPDWDEEEGDLFFEQHTEVSLEDRRCCECHAPIFAGTEHEHIWGIWEGDESNYYTCLPCAQIRADFCCDGVAFTTLWEALREAFRDIKGGDDLEWLVP